MSLQPEPGARGRPRGHGGRPSRLESAQLSDRILDVAAMLFEAVVRRLVERWTPSFDTAMLEAPSLAEGLRQTAEYMLKVALTPEALALHRMVIAESSRSPALARVLHELGQAAGVERVARHLETRI